MMLGEAFARPPHWNTDAENIRSPGCGMSARLSSSRRSESAATFTGMAAPNARSADLPKGGHVRTKAAWHCAA